MRLRVDPPKKWDSWRIYTAIPRTHQLQAVHKEAVESPALLGPGKQESLQAQKCRHCNDTGKKTGVGPDNIQWKSLELTGVYWKHKGLGNT